VQISRTQQETLDNIQRMLTQLLTNRNNEENSENHDWKEENKTLEDSNIKESSSIDAEVIKGIQAQIASLAQWDELKKVRMTHPYLLEWD